jgi:hypothetical protein
LLDEDQSATLRYLAGITGVPPIRAMRAARVVAADMPVLTRRRVRASSQQRHRAALLL